MWGPWLLACVGPAAETVSDDTAGTGPTGPWIAVAAGTGVSCGLDRDGAPHCWGGEGNLLYDVAGEWPVIVETPDIQGQVELVMSTLTACSAGQDSVTCWGSEAPWRPETSGTDLMQYYGKAAVLTTDHELLTPYPDDFPNFFLNTKLAILPSTCESHVCALDLDGQAVCGQMNPTYGGRLDAIPGTFVEIACSVNECCALDAAGTLHCGMYQDGGPTPGSEVMLPEIPGPWHGLASEWWAFCALDADGQPVCWPLSDSTQPLADDRPLGTYTRLDVGELHACALRTDGFIDCWGSNAYGQLDVPEI